MTSTSLSADEVRKAVQQQAGKLLSQVAGFVGVRTVEIGLRLGLLEEIGKHNRGSRWRTHIRHFEELIYERIYGGSNTNKRPG